MQCPKCSFLMDDFMTECPRCRYMKTTPAPDREQPILADAPGCDAPPAHDNVVGMRVLVAVLITLFLVGGAAIYWNIYHARKGTLHGKVFVTQERANLPLGMVTVAVYPFNTLNSCIEKKKAYAEKETAKRQARIDAARDEMQRQKSEMEQRASEEKVALAERLGIAPTGFDTGSMRQFMSAINQADIALRESGQAYRQAQQAFAAAEHAYNALLEEQYPFLTGDFFFKNLPKPWVVVETDALGQFDVALPTRGQFVICIQAARNMSSEDGQYYWMLKVSLDGAARKAIFLSNDNMTTSGASDSLVQTNVK